MNPTKNIQTIQIKNIQKISGFIQNERNVLSLFILNMRQINMKNFEIGRLQNQIKNFKKSMLILKLNVLTTLLSTFIWQHSVQKYLLWIRLLLALATIPQMTLVNLAFVAFCHVNGSLFLLAEFIQVQLMVGLKSIMVPIVIRLFPLSQFLMILTVLFIYVVINLTVEMNMLLAQTIL